MTPINRRKKKIEEIATPLPPLQGGNKTQAERKGTATCGTCGTSGVRGVDVHRHRSANGKTSYLHEGCKPNEHLNPIPTGKSREDFI
jgi:hypothetical protein